MTLAGQAEHSLRGSRGQSPIVALRRARDSFLAPAGAYPPKTEQGVRNGESHSEGERTRPLPLLAV